MCGIIGMFGNEVNDSDLEAMLNVANRRGPEGAHTKKVKGGKVGHTALKFVDTQQSYQPLEDDSSVIVYNGEIYNWEELNKKYNLNARNDTFTLIRGLKLKGVDFLKEIDGQFAFIAQMQNEKGNIETIVARDKWGISPLAYGVNEKRQVVVGSTIESVEKAGAKKVMSVPAGTYGILKDDGLSLDYWFKLPKVSPSEQAYVDPQKIASKARKSVVDRIPDEKNILFSTMGGIDSQFITATIARNTKGEFGGAVTVVPWNPKDPENKTLGDYKEAKATVEMLEKEGIKMNHYVVQLTPEYVNKNLDRLLKLLGPDYFNICCGMPEDLVASTVKSLGGKAIMTAGGPDEAGRSYKNWTQMCKSNLEQGFYDICDQFASAEGVRAGLVFGEHGLENRVPLAFLIEDAAYMPAEQKQRVYDFGDGYDQTTVKMDDKLFWRQGVKNDLPEVSLAKPKETIHGATGTKLTLYHVALSDSKFQQERSGFINELNQYGWNALVAGDTKSLNQENIITEGQLYCLYRWSRVEPELFKKGVKERFGNPVTASKSGMVLPVYSSDIDVKAQKPLCYDWQLSEEFV